MFERLSSPVELEESVRALWDRIDIHGLTETLSAGRPRFVFYEGPPTANGLPHNGHVLTRVMKDVIPRFQTMRGRRVLRKGGWDTHGLPVEVEVEKGLGIHGKEAIEEYGLEKFSRRCVDSVFTYVNEWEENTRLIGYHVDLANAYVTYHRSYVESVWWALSELFERGLLYQGHKVVWWWPQGGTALSAGEVGMGYRTVRDPAITVRIRDSEDPTLSYLAWTTTPWTLPSNVALAVGEDVEYAYCADPEGGTVVVAVALAESYGLVPLRRVRGRDLVGRRYRPLFDFGRPEGGDGYVIVTGHHVTTDAGTGIVHTAPAFGEDDLEIAKTHGLGMLQWVAPNGCFREGTGALEGLFCKDADRVVIRDLEARGALFRRDSIEHEYPFCWRAEEDPLIQYARPAWFVRTTSRNAEALANNDAVTWHPAHIQHGRFGDFLRNNVDWALSRERFWGTPLNIWECGACAHRIAPPSVAAIRALAPDAFDPDVDEHLQVHRPWVDEVVLPCAACGGSMRRVPEVIDCWFDSGCMPFAQWGFPHQGVEAFKDQFPADFICEAVDQTRGWFYSLLMISTLLFDDDTCARYGLDPVGYPRPYRNCVVLGHVGDMEGRKESKSKGNYTSPNLVMVGTTRLAVLADPSLRPGTVGLKAAQVRSLDLGGKDRVTLSAERDATPSLLAKVVAADVGPKDTVALHPDDLAVLGLPEQGGALWFRVPGEPPGADAFRWLFCAASPPWSNTRLSLRTVRDGQREFLLRLKNVHQFFSIYADIAAQSGQFDPTLAAPRAPAERSRLDRWVLHELHAAIGAVTDHLEGYRVYDAARALLGFVEGLSNWYVRRSRERFWGEGDDLVDALWTLYEVLVATSKLLAPFCPFMAEAMYRSLVVGPLGDAVSASVHLVDWPSADPALLDPELAADMALVRQLASLGLAARAATRIKVRQPLGRATIVLADPARQAAVESLADALLAELNVRELTFEHDAADLVSYRVKPDFKRLGPRLGPKVKSVAAALAGMDGSAAKAGLDTGSLTIHVDGEPIVLTPEDCSVQVLASGDYEAASSPVAVVALSTVLTDDLKAEGFVRELVNRVQNLRKELDLGYTQRIALAVDGDTVVRDALARFGDHLRAETLARTLQIGAPQGDGWERRSWDVEGTPVQGAVRAL